MDRLLDRFLELVQQEAAEVRRAPFTFALAIVTSLALGYWYAARFYAERIEILELQRDAAAGGLQLPPAKTSTLFQPNTGFILVAVLAAVARVWLAVRSMRNRHENRALVKQIDTLLWDQTEGRKAWTTERAQLEQGRDKAMADLKDRQNVYALETLRRYAGFKFDNGLRPRVTIRYSSYGKDWELAQAVKALVDQHLRWPVTLDASNVPALPRAESFKVVFDLGMTGFIYGDLVHAFSEGNLLGVPVGQRQFVERADNENLIVLVLPSPGSEQAK